MCSKLIFDFLLDKLINENGTGTKALQEKLDAGEISQEDYQILKLKANVITLRRKLEVMTS